MSYHTAASIEHGNLELCKEQFAIIHPTYPVSTLTAVVAYDESADSTWRYYACIFERAATTGMSGLRSRPKLLFKGLHQLNADVAIKAMLSTLSLDVGNMIAADRRTFQMSSGVWRGSCDFTARPGNGIPVGSSNVVDSRNSANASQQVVNEDVPPACTRVCDIAPCDSAG